MDDSVIAELAHYSELKAQKVASKYVELNIFRRVDCSPHIAQLHDVIPATWVT